LNTGDYKIHYSTENGKDKKVNMQNVKELFVNENNYLVLVSRKEDEEENENEKVRLIKERKIDEIEYYPDNKNE
jgi:hypothetical protein